MLNILRFNFSHTFKGVIWNIVSDIRDDVVVIEVRNSEEKKAYFNALNFQTNTFLWKDRFLEEPWWVNLTVVADGLIVFTLYQDTNNPDRKGVLAYELVALELKWWNNDFSVSALTSQGLKGFSSRLGLRELLLDLKTGKEHQNQETAEILTPRGLRRPLQYIEGTEYFETVRTFLIKRLNLAVVSALEYAETDKCMVISCYTKITEEVLANFLLVFSREGECLLREEIGTQLQGIGLDTFFLLRNNLFFVKNKRDLVSYTIL